MTTATFRGCKRAQNMDDRLDRVNILVYSVSKPCLWKQLVDSLKGGAAGHNRVQVYHGATTFSYNSLELTWTNTHNIQHWHPVAR